MDLPDAWQNEGLMCDFFCVRQRDQTDPEDMGSDYPEWECDLHWAPHHPMRSKVAIKSIAGWLKGKAPDEATSSRDFGRGFMRAVQVLQDQAEGR